MSGTSGNCGTCLGPSSLSNVKSNQLKLDLLIRTNITILFIYAFVFLATIGIFVYVLYMLYYMYRQWRIMSDAANPDMKNVDEFSLVGLRDDEIYQSDIDDMGPAAALASDRISAAMDRLGSVYSDYNKQITQYSKDVLKEKPDDIFDRSVLDSAKDDFKYKNAEKLHS